MKHVPFAVVTACVTAVILYLLYVTNSDPAGHTMLVAWIVGVLNDGWELLSVGAAIVLLVGMGVLLARLN